MKTWIGASLTVALAGLAFSKTPPPPRPLQPTVLIIGGSAAYGWYDRSGLGFVERGLKAWNRWPRGVAFKNQAVPGATVRNPTIRGNYHDWLHDYRPTIVALQWGMLNDLRVGTPWSLIMAVIRKEIMEAIAIRAVVMIITPPATEATYDVDRGTEVAVVAEELKMARSLNNPNVYAFNVLGAMKTYLAPHHLTYAPFMKGPWDPNTRGHRLAGRLLAAELKKKLPRGQVQFQTEGAFTPGIGYFTGTRWPLGQPLLRRHAVGKAKPAKNNFKASPVTKGKNPSAHT